jgi:hypothetical protein
MDNSSGFEGILIDKERTEHENCDTFYQSAAKSGSNSRYYQFITLCSPRRENILMREKKKTGNAALIKKGLSSS